MHGELPIRLPKEKSSDLSVFPAAEAYIGMAHALSSRGHDFSVGGGAEALLAIAEKILGPGHPDVATNLNNLAGWK